MKKYECEVPAIVKQSQMITVLIFPLLCAVDAYAQAAQQDWLGCVERLRKSAIADGIAPRTVDDVLGNVAPLPRVISSDRAQPEFTRTFTDYYTRRVTDRRTAKGRRLLQEHNELLQNIKAETDVPPQYLVALWGLETNFGSYLGNLPLPSALTTLACDNRRPEFFQTQLFAALRIIDAGDIAAAKMVGSWAGAIGHMQFMPTTFLNHAVDADLDGRRDLLGSIADALSSGARYLADIGWQAGYRWGREVILPDDFDYARSGSDNRQPLSEWAKLGVLDVFGNPLASLDLPSAIVLPSGHTGPAFVVYPNFRVIMEWNRSEHYALSVGRLADRIAGSGRLHRRPAEAPLTLATIKQLQTNLTALGFDTRGADGVLGPATRKAIQRFQQSHNMIADGYPHKELMARLAAATAPQ